MTPPERKAGERCPATKDGLVCIRTAGHSTQFFPPDGHNWQPSIERVSVERSLECYPEYPRKAGEMEEKVKRATLIDKIQWAIDEIKRRTPTFFSYAKPKAECTCSYSGRTGTVNSCPVHGGDW